MVSKLKTYWIIGFLLVVSVLFVFNSKNFSIDTDITNVFPLSEKEKGIASYLNDMEVFDRYTIIVSVNDSTQLSIAQAVVEQVCDSLNAPANDSLFEYVQYGIEDSQIDRFYSLAYDYLPFFLEEKDYQTLDSLIQKENMKEVMHRQYNTLMSPAGMFFKPYFVKDPLGFSFIPMKKFAKGFAQDVTLDEGFFVSAAKKDVLFFVKTKASKNDYQANKKSYEYINSVLAHYTRQSQLKPETSVYGGALIAFQNSEQVQEDMNLTVGITISLIVLVVLLAFRNIWSPFVLITPVFFSTLSAVLCIYYIQGGVSGIAIGAGSVVLGIAMDFCIHFYSHYLESGSIEETKKDILFPLFMGSVTTSGAFFSLLFTESKLLQDLGLFAGIAILFAFLYTITLVPLLIKIFNPKPSVAILKASSHFLSRNIKITKWGVLLFLLFTSGMFYFAADVKFDSDISNLAYKSEEVIKSEQKVNEVSKGVSKYVYFLVKEDSITSAYQKVSSISSLIDSIYGNSYQGSKGILDLFVDEQERALKIERWNQFWSGSNRQALFAANLKEVASGMGFKPEVFQGIHTKIAYKDFPIQDSINAAVSHTFLSDYNKTTSKQSAKGLIIPFKVDEERKSSLIEGFTDNEEVWIIDRQSLVNKFAITINSDFQYVLTVSSLLVFIILFHLFGRVELAVITFLPMIISWVWILGLMGINNIHFNIVNIILCTFIFGLGDDYSIFMTEAKLSEYKEGKTNLGVYRFSVLLSCITTVAGMAALFWAKHPAIHSIAFVSVVGILCVTTVSFLIIPSLFDWFITSRVKKGKYPITFLDLIKSVYLYMLFVVGAVLINMVVGILWVLRIYRWKKVRYMVNYLIMYTTKGLVYAIFFMRKSFHLPDAKLLAQPSIIIANHRSFIDIVITTMLKPKIVLVAADWVWNVPILGKVLDCGGYIRASMNPEEQLVLIKQRLAEGYSIVIFPEGTRNTEGGIKRFHKGAFYLAEACQATIIPLVIHGSGDCITKGDDYIVKSGLVSIRTLAPILPADTNFGTSYQERSKSIRKHMETAYETLKAEQEQPAYFRSRLLKNYLYKGTVLEWYLWVKIRIEKDYAIFHQHLPEKGNFLDLGCGYGFLSYMLRLLSPERHIVGVDYDEQKIKVAHHGVLRDEHIRFVHADASLYPLDKYDAIVISDVLHYLPVDKQRKLIASCIESLNSGGVLLIRDADTSIKKDHLVTRLSEVFSTRIMRFNKTDTNPLEFVPLEQILSDISRLYEVKVEPVSLQKHTSNVLFKISSNL